MGSFVFSYPIKKTFALGQHAKSLAEHFPEHSVGYLEIREQLETSAKELLGHCNDSKEVETLLRFIPLRSRRKATSEHDFLFMSALHQEQTPFVAHPYYQQFLRSSLGYDTGGSLTSGVFKKFCSIFTALLAFYLYPTIIVVDSLFREHNSL